MRRTLLQGGLMLAALFMISSTGATAQSTQRGIDPGERRELRADRREIRADTRDIRSDATFVEMSEIVGATYASIAKTNAKAPRCRSCEPIATRSVRTHMR